MRVVVEGSGCARQRSLNSIVKFYGVDCTMARGDRTTAVVFRHLASFSELPQRKQVFTEEQVRNGKRVREIYVSELASREAWMKKASNWDICEQCTPLQIDYCYNTVQPIQKPVKN